MPELSLKEQDWLREALASLVARRGATPLLSSLLLEQSDRFFPDLRRAGRGGAPQPARPASARHPGARTRARRAGPLLRFPARPERAAPGLPGREAEAIAQEVWALVKADESSNGGEPLRLSDIAVMVAAQAPETHFTHLASGRR